MSEVELVILTLLIALFAALYASVGHGGASGYLAAMALLGVAPAEMRPTALTLNVLVSSLATAHFAASGHFHWRQFLPFALPSVPLAFLGGMILLPGWGYRPLVGLALGWAAWRLLRRSTSMSDEAHAIPLSLAVAAGAGLGLLSGLTGVGGGIYLSPLLLLTGWATPRQAAAVAAAFVLVNSVSGLGGYIAGGGDMPWTLLAWTAPVAVVAGWFGARMGSRRLPNPRIRQLLAVVLFIAAVKMVVEDLW